MKNVRIILAVWLMIVACQSKKNDPQPDLAGTYQMTRLAVSSSNVDVSLPSTTNGIQLSGVIVVTRVSNTRIRWQGSITNNGRTTTADAVEADLRQTNGGTYEMIDNGVLIGTIDGTTFSVDYNDTANGRTIITGRK